jgi:hypothetical protein
MTVVRAPATGRDVELGLLVFATRLIPLACVPVHAVGWFGVSAHPASR